jgi:hypothetical protein
MVIFIIMFALEYLFNNVCLKNLYIATASVWRPEADMMKLIPYYWAALLVASFLFTYIYAKGCEAKPSALGEGLRFGLIVGLFVNLPMATITYATMPLPDKIPIYWFIMGMFEYLAAGAIAGLMYKKA